MGPRPSSRRGITGLFRPGVGYVSRSLLRLKSMLRLINSSFSHQLFLDWFNVVQYWGTRDRAIASRAKVNTSNTALLTQQPFALQVRLSHTRSSSMFPTINRSWTAPQPRRMSPDTLAFRSCVTTQVGLVYTGLSTTGTRCSLGYWCAQVRRADTTGRPQR